MPVVYARMQTVLGLVELAFYVASILLLSAAVTYAVVKISPTKTAKPQPDKSLSRPPSAHVGLLADAVRLEDVLHVELPPGQRRRVALCERGGEARKRKDHRARAREARTARDRIVDAPALAHEERRRQVVDVEPARVRHLSRLAAQRAADRSLP